MPNLFEQDKIYFDEETHAYFYKDSGRRLISPTTIIKQYSNPFDPDGTILKRCAAKKGITPEELDAEWKKIGSDARDKGHSIHFSFEHYIKTNEILDDDNKDIIKDFQDNVRIDLEGTLYPEVTLFNLDYGIAGRTDLIHNWWENIVDCLDFKTNKKISKFSFGKYMYYPLNHLPDASFFHYECQLSLYSLMLEAQGYCPRKLNLLWINPKKRKLEVIPVQYRRDDMLRLLEHYNNEKNNSK